MGSRNVVWMSVAISALVVVTWIGQGGSPSAMAGDLVPKVSQQKWEYAQLQHSQSMVYVWLPGQGFNSYEDAMKGLRGEPRSGINGVTMVHDVMNKLGELGWELVSMKHAVDRNGNDNDMFYFKRAK